MSKAITKRPNQAATAVHGDYKSKFGEGQTMATTRQHPTDGNGKNHNTDDGVRA